jgi:nitrogen fixation NifU-like protein
MDIVEALNLPPVKLHCSVLAEEAIRTAVNDYRHKNGLEPLVLEDEVALEAFEEEEEEESESAFH